jgi:Arc/MetJ family transcription regulator
MSGRIKTTRLAPDKTLLAEAHKRSGCRTKAETVHAALREFIQRRKQLEISRQKNGDKSSAGLSYREEGLTSVSVPSPRQPDGG